MARTTYKTPCISIGALDWLEKPEVQKWTQSRDNGAALYIGTDVFFTYNHGDSPVKNADRPIPGWLWEKVQLILKANGLEHDYFCTNVKVEGDAQEA